MKNLNQINKTDQKIEIHLVITSINEGLSTKFMLIFALWAI